MLLLIVGGGIWWRYCTQPAPVKRPVFQGIVYERRVWKKPRPVTIHMLVIDTRTPGLRFIVTPPDHPGEDKPLEARRTSEFVQEHQLQAAINADFFSPWLSENPLDYYPHKRDRVNVEGDAVTEGVRYADKDEEAKPFPTFYLSRNNRPSLHLSKGEKPWNAVGGHPLLENNVPFQGPSDLQPRTAAGWTPDGKTLYLVCIDGRQKGYSEGISLSDLAHFFQSLGCKDAINLDGGGSTSMVISDGNGGTEVLNQPIDQHFPGRQRYIANHIGIYAPTLTR